MSPPVVSGIGRPRLLDWRADHGFDLVFDAQAGLYTVRLHVNAADFDWESLILPMTAFGNSGQRTGPWDFNLFDGQSPLLPTWRMAQDGRDLGLFYLRRPSVEDMAQRRLRGEFGLRVQVAGPVSIRARPLATFTIAPLSLLVERCAFDHLQAPDFAPRGREANWVHRLSGSESWLAARRRLAAREWEPLLRAAAATATARPITDAEGLPTLIAARYLVGTPDDDASIAARVRHLLGMPAWGNPDPLGYGHNGDMICASVIRSLAYAAVWMPELRPDILPRLERQIACFLEQQILHAQYWGGATLQDHGLRSTATIVTAALALLGYSDAAPNWLAYYVPRLMRTVDHLPHDGFIPAGSYHKLGLYVSDLTEARYLLRGAGGPDIFDRTPAFRRVPDHLMASLDAESGACIVSTNRGDRKPLNGGLPFLLALCESGAETAPAAAGLADYLLRSYRRDPRAMSPRAVDTLWLAILGDRGQPLRPLDLPHEPTLVHFPDAGALHYREPRGRIQVAALCGPNTACIHAVGSDLNTTDQIVMNASAGAFVVAVAGRPLIMNAESGYRTGSHLSNVLLIDGRGQYGDVGYPMGVPSDLWRGQRIQVCRSEPGGGYARLNLAPAYPDALQLLEYFRDMWFEGSRLRVRDTVVAQAAHNFNYRFHSYRRHRLAIADPGHASFAHEAGRIDLRHDGGADWRLGLGETEVVWAYGNEHDDEPFCHLEVATTRMLQAFCLEFTMDMEQTP